MPVLLRVTSPLSFGFLGVPDNRKLVEIVPLTSDTRSFINGVKDNGLGLVHFNIKIKHVRVILSWPK
jgi:hypothetical protein